MVKNPSNQEGASLFRFTRQHPAVQPGCEGSSTAWEIPSGALLVTVLVGLAEKGRDGPHAPRFSAIASGGAAQRLHRAGELAVGACGVEG